MEKLDAIIAVAGVLVLGVAVAGSALYGGADAAAAYRVEFPVTDQDLAAAEASLPAPGAPAGGATRADVPVEVHAANLTLLTFTVELRNAAVLAGNAEFRFTLLDPEGVEVAQSGSGTLGPAGSAVTLTADAPLAEPPEPRTVEAADPGTAAANAAQPTTNGTGTWTLVIEGATTGAATGDFPATVTVTGRTYEAVVAPEGA